MEFRLIMRRLGPDEVSFEGHGHSQRVIMPRAFVTAAFHSGEEVEVHLDGETAETAKVVRFIPELRTRGAS